MLDEQRVALRPPGHGGNDVLGRGAAEQRIELCGNVPVIETAQLEDHRPRAAADVGPGLARCRCPVRLAGCQHHQQALVAERAHQEAHDVEGRAVGPLQVVDPQQHGSSAADPAEQVEELTEQARPGELGWQRRPALRPGELRDELPELGNRTGAQRLALAAGQATHRPAQGGRERQVGRRRRQLEAGAFQHQRVRSFGLPGQAPHETGLADPGLPGDQDHHRVAGGSPRQRLAEQLELGPPTHERPLAPGWRLGPDRRTPCGHRPRPTVPTGVSWG